MKTVTIKEHTLIEEYLNNKPLTIIDMGACMGEFSLGVNDKFSVKKSILVEANPTNFKKLPQNENFIALNKAVYIESNTQIKFKEDVTSPYNGSIILDHFSNIAKEHVIDTISLKDLIILMNIENHIDILKIDIEGCEYMVLENASDEDLLKFKQITIEFHDFVDVSLKNKNQNIENRFKSLGFSVIKNKTNYLHGSDYYDTLFYKN
jgi:FkbM family methyltransferase